MDHTDSVSYTWRIPNFATLSSIKLPLFSTINDEFIKCKRAKLVFGMRIEYNSGPSDVFPRNFCEINLSRSWNTVNDTDLAVLWKIWFVNQNGVECLSRDIETGYSTTSLCYPVSGGLYRVDLDYILDPSNGLLTDGTLIIKCQITVLGKSLKIDLKKPNLIAMKAFEDYESLLESSKHSDVVVVIGKNKKEFNLHKAILSARSPVFSRMFDQLAENQQNRIEITGIKVEVFEQLLHFIYGGNISSLDENAADLLVAADKYQLELLKQLCVQTLSTTTISLTVNNVATVLTLADMANAAELKSKCIEFITANASNVIDTEGLKQMALNRVELMMELYRDMAVQPNKKQRKK